MCRCLLTHLVIQHIEEAKFNREGAEALSNKVSGHYSGQTLYCDEKNKNIIDETNDPLQKKKRTFCQTKKS